MGWGSDQGYSGGPYRAPDAANAAGSSPSHPTTHNSHLALTLTLTLALALVGQSRVTSASWPTWPGQSGHLGRRVPRSAERFQHRGGSVGALGAPSEAETHAETAVAGQSGHLGRRVRRRLTLKPPSRVSRGTRGAECLRTSSRTRGTRAAECCAPHSRNRRHVDTLTRWTRLALGHLTRACHSSTRVPPLGALGHPT